LSISFGPETVRFESVSPVRARPFAVPHSMRRTKATLIYRRTKNLRAVQLLLSYTKLKALYVLGDLQRVVDYDPEITTLSDSSLQRFATIITGKRSSNNC
jgi:hypothetical protein